MSAGYRLSVLLLSVLGVLMVRRGLWVRLPWRHGSFIGLGTFEEGRDIHGCGWASPSYTVRVVASLMGTRAKGRATERADAKM